MSIWFYLFLITLIILIIKIVLTKRELKNISKSLLKIINSDTNSLITLDYSNKDLKELVSILNKSLKELRELELEYKNGNKEFKKIITNISHDLRTPLTAIKGYVDLLENEKLTLKQIKYLKIIDSKVTDLTILTSELFDYSKVLDKELKNDFIYLNDILEDVIASFYTSFKEYNLNPVINITNEKVGRYLNQNVVKRIFSNIISNAIKYSEGEFKIKLSSNGVIEFSNKTSKLSNIELERLFDGYYTVIDNNESNGIGLSIAKELVDKCNGNIFLKYKNNVLTIRISL